LDASIDVMTPLEIDVLEKISADMEFPYISMPARRGIAPSTGMSRFARLFIDRVC
jgi:hypothetical protein